MKRLVIAFGFLTRLPMPSVAGSIDGTAFAEAIRFYPLVGLAIGALVAGAGWAGSLVDPWVGACAALLAWIAITGALHLDGLADLVDGLGAAHGDRTRLLAVMADPHIGSFGVVAIVGQMLAKLVLLHALGMVGWWSLLCVPGVARIGPMVWARYLPPIRPGGLGAAVAGAVRARDLLGWGALVALAALFDPALVAGPVAILAMTFWFGRTLGGINGDAHGAGIELVETVLLATICVVALR